MRKPHNRQFQGEGTASRKGCKGEDKPCAQGIERRPLWLEFVKGREGWDEMRSHS